MEVSITWLHRQFASLQQWILPTGKEIQVFEPHHANTQATGQCLQMLLFLPGTVFMGGRTLFGIDCSDMYRPFFALWYYPSQMPSKEQGKRLILPEATRDLAFDNADGKIIHRPDAQCESDYSCFRKSEN
ncbi:hypothetical protein CS542_05655 [Pedobacter sp. IW39]|nr:hypothetical protein CS542_05655 [Pedobacter sp. IW39]